MEEDELETDLAVVLDACVLIPASLRDALLYPAVLHVYRPLWSAQILDEVRRNLLELKRGQPITPESADKLIHDLRRAFPAALVTEHVPLIESMTNDPKDRHVLAAAVAAHAQVIVTTNLKDFPSEALAPHQVEAQHPDVFLSRQFDRDPDQMRLALESQIRKLRKPPRTYDEVLDTLAQHTPHFVRLLRGEVK
jgi:predicted nucleic acid-binding protein